MGAGLSLAEQIEEHRKSGVKFRAGDHWSGRLEEWLSAALPPGAYERYGWLEDGHAVEEEDGPGADETVLEWTDRRREGVQTWSFPTDELRSEYLASVAERPESEVLALLRLFLFEESCFAHDTQYLHEAVVLRREVGKPQGMPTEYWRRLVAWIGGDVKPHPSIRWVLDLLPKHPQSAVDAVAGYKKVYRFIRPSGRDRGLEDAIAIIRAR
ncbi:hypothetical protein [Lentzea cavernae]|uniref:Uncharacterized protein n=1 Tax=Lentzea cavernae TaxID=2020703 RepID=A0ABQ3MU58_9PSEU|nr:hypothetical protein [Lentzea cavernae]GHH57945.1 hypothetical protein GCM10017774_78550 [Lentzea cavernae]